AGRPEGGVTTAALGLLAGWLTEQRWFAGKGHAIDDLSIDSLTEIRPGDPGLVHLIVSVRQADRRTRYQLLVGLRTELRERLRHALIGCCEWPDEGERHLYDAAHDAALSCGRLANMAAELRVGDLYFHRGPGMEIDTLQRSLVLTAEQSNTSLVYGDKYIL